MDEHIRETLFDLCNFFDVISQKSIGVTQLKRPQEEIMLILCELEIYFLPLFSTLWCIFWSMSWRISFNSGLRFCAA
jgi:hypothetical protein